MLNTYAIWDKQSQVITPIGEVLSAEEWKERYPVANTNLTIVCGAGAINGSFFGVLENMVLMYEAQGADFSEAETNEEKLEVIEAWDAQAGDNNGESTPEERIAAALEYNNLLNSPVINEDDPDEE